MSSAWTWAYNERANDGGTIFMTTRSMGQIEEGPAGFSIAAVDGRGVSWCFKPLDEAWPFVLITHPADRRLPTAASRASAPMVRARIIGGAPIAAALMRAHDSTWTPMQPAPVCAGARRIAVRARDAKSRTDEDQVEPRGQDWTPPKRHADGSDADRVGAWPERGIAGTQLCPNRHGRKW